MLVMPGYGSAPRRACAHMPTNKLQAEPANISQRNISQRIYGTPLRNNSTFMLTSMHAFGHECDVVVTCRNGDDAGKVDIGPVKQARDKAAEIKAKRDKIMDMLAEMKSIHNQVM